MMGYCEHGIETSSVVRGGQPRESLSDPSASPEGIISSCYEYCRSLVQFNFSINDLYGNVRPVQAKPHIRTYTLFFIVNEGSCALYIFTCVCVCVCVCEDAETV